MASYFRTLFRALLGKELLTYREHVELFNAEHSRLTGIDDDRKAMRSEITSLWDGVRERSDKIADLTQQLADMDRARRAMQIKVESLGDALSRADHGVRLAASDYIGLRVDLGMDKSDDEEQES